MTGPPYGQGEMRLAILGQLHRAPGSAYGTVAADIEAPNADSVRVVLGRLRSSGLVRRVGRGHMLTRQGLDHLERVRRWVAV